MKEIESNDYLMGKYPSGYKTAILMNFFGGKAETIGQMTKREMRDKINLTSGAYSVDSINSNGSMFQFCFTLK